MRIEQSASRWCVEVALAACATIGFVSAAGPVAGSQEGATPHQRSRIDSIMAGVTAQGPGAAVAVVRDGRVVFTGAHGLANLATQAPIGPATVFDVASIAKQITGFMVLLLVSEGRLHLDDDVHRYVPELPDYGRAITISQLLHQTSGLRDYAQTLDLAGVQLQREVVTEREVLDLTIRQRHLNFTPGAEFLYSNTNYFLLGLIVARVTGRSLPEFARKAVFEPLGMTHTHFAMTWAGGTGAHARGFHAQDDGTLRPDSSRSEVVGDGNLFTTVEDLARWDANFVTARLGGRHVVELMTSDVRLPDGTPAGYGCGLVLDRRYRDWPVIEHGGSEAGFRSDLLRIPAAGVDVIVAGNRSDLDADALARRIADVFLPYGTTASNRSSASPVAVRVRAETLAAWVGTYWNQEGYTRRFMAHGDTLLVSADGGQPHPMTPLGAHEFGLGAASYEFRRLVSGEGYGVYRREEGHATRHFVPVPRPAVGPIPPVALAGTYTSPEIGVEWRIQARGDTIQLVRPGAADDTLVPVFADAYSSEPGLLRFTRGADGRAASFGVWSERLRNVEFTRVHP